jgi:GlpG protein
MRQIATMQDGDAARAFADYLLTQQIDTQLGQQAGGWELWVRDEDCVARAKEAFEAFQRDPLDARFADAKKAAQRLRQEEARKEKEAARRQVKLGGEWTDQQTPWITFGLMAVCLAVYAAHVTLVVFQNPQLGPVQAVGAANFLNEDKHRVVSPIEQALFIQRVFLFDGELAWEKPQTFIDANWIAEPWRLITPIFFHIGPLHLVFNLGALAALGSQFERRRGPLRFIALVLTCAVFSNLVQLYAGRPYWDGGLVLRFAPLFGGMSGVIYGVFGYLWMKSRYFPEIGLHLSSGTIGFMLLWLVFCFTGLVGPVANAAHVAGLAFGAAVGAAPLIPRLFRRD